MTRACLLVLALVLLLVGCGGGGGDNERLSREEYASRADAICGKYRAQVEALATPDTFAELADASQKTLSILDKAADELRELRPPANEETTAREWLRQFDVLKRDVEKLRERAEANDRAGVQALVAPAQRHNERANELARKLGMRVCSRD